MNEFEQALIVEEARIGDTPKDRLIMELWEGFHPISFDKGYEQGYEDAIARARIVFDDY